MWVQIETGEEEKSKSMDINNKKKKKKKKPVKMETRGFYKNGEN